MTSGTKQQPAATVGNVALSSDTTASSISLPDYEKSRIEDIGFVTAMTLVVMGNYAQTGHFGGPLA